MQGVSYLPRNFYRMDHIGGANGSLLPLVNNGGTCNGGRAYIMSPPGVSSLDQHLAYNKELVRQTMLKQEAVFRAQVCELHRLYTRQRELMDEIRGREQSVDHIRKQSSQPCYFPSKMLPGVSQNPVQMPRWLLVNPRESMTPGNLEKLLTSVSEQSSYRDSSICLEKNYLREEDRASSSKRRNCGKTNLDLELPAEAYIDDNDDDDDDDELVLMEQNTLETPRISLDPFNRTTWTDNLGQNPSKESSCNANSSCLKTNYLLDLNESPQLGESGTAKYNSCVESHSSITGLKQKDLSARLGSISSHPDENIHCGVNEVNSTHGHPTSFSAVNISCAFPDERKSKTSSLHKNALETSAVIQGLPCFNIPESLSGNPKFSRINSGFKRKIEPEGPSSMGSATTGMNKNGICENVTEHHSNKRYIKELNAAKSLNEMDLNVTPSSCLTETEIDGENIGCGQVPNMLEDHTGKINKLKSQPDSGIGLVECPNFRVTSVSSQSCALVSSSVQKKSSEIEDVLNRTKPGVSCSSHSSNQSETNSKKDSKSNFVTEKELAKTKISGTESSQALEREVGSNLVLSVSPDDKEHSPFNENPDDNVNEISFQFSVQKIGNPDEDIEKISAETIISLSKPRPQDFLKASSKPVEKTPSDCLDWFADIICSAAAAASHPEINLEKLSTPRPGGIKQPRKYNMTLKCTKAKVDDQLSAFKRTRNKRTAWSSGMFVQQANSRRSKKQMQMKEFQSEDRLHVDSLSSCVMNTCGRNLNKQSRAKKSQSQSGSTFMSPPNRRTKKICVGPDHFTNVNEARCPLSYLCVWGKKNTRQKGRRARADNLSW